MNVHTFANRWFAGANRRRARRYDQVYVEPRVRQGAALPVKHANIVLGVHRGNVTNASSHNLFRGERGTAGHTPVRIASAEPASTDIDVRAPPK